MAERLDDSKNTRLESGQHRTKLRRSRVIEAACLQHTVSALKLRCPSCTRSQPNQTRYVVEIGMIATWTSHSKRVIMQNHTAGEGRWAHGGERREPLITAESAAHRSFSASAAMSSDTVPHPPPAQPPAHPPAGRT